MSSRSSSLCAGGVAFVVAIAAALHAPPAAAIAADAVELPATSQRPRTPIPLERTLPLFYEANRGQAPDGWDFLVRCTGYHAFVRSDEAVFSFDGAGLSLALDGARRVAPDVRGLEMKAHANYFIGNDPTKWISDVPLSRGAVYRDVAHGTTWRLGASGRRLEFSLVVPGTDEPRFRLAGARTVTVGGDGTLRIAMPTGEATFTAPVAWQLERSGARHTVTARYVVEEDGEFRIALGERDAGRKTFVDPTVSYESYLGHTADEYARAAAVDSSGSAYVAGVTHSASFPTTSGAYDTSHNSAASSRNDAFVVKLSSSGTSLAYATFVGSSSDEEVCGLDIDASGNAVFGGFCFGSNLPTTSGVVGSTVSGTQAPFLTKLNSSGTQLVWSTYVNGVGNAIATALGPSGNPYILSTPGSVCRLAADATSIDYAVTIAPTVMTGGNSQLRALATDASDALYVAGSTSQSNFKITAGTYQTQLAGRNDAVLLKLDSAGKTLWSTLLGGTFEDHAYGVGVDAAGRPSIAGETASTDLPTTTGAYQTTTYNAGKESGDTDAFFARFSADGKSLRTSTYVGGTAQTGAYSLRVHPSGAAYLCGYTDASDFPTKSAFQDTYAGGGPDGFVLKFDHRDRLAWSSFVGGSDLDWVQSVAIGADGSLIGVGATRADDLPTSSAYQSSHLGNYDALFLEIPDSLPTSTTLPEVVTSALPDWTVGVPLDVSLESTGGLAPRTWAVIEGAPPDGMSFDEGGTLTGTPSAAGSYQFSVRLTDDCDFTDDGQVSLRVNPAPSIHAATFPDWTVGVPFEVAIDAVDGTGALTRSIGSGALPPGLTIAPDGIISGTPTTAGTATFTVRVTDDVGAVATRTFSQKVNASPSIDAATLPGCTEGRPYSYAFGTTGGTGPLTWSVVSGTLPTPSDVAATLGKLSGACRSAGTYDFALRVTDTHGAHGERSFTVVLQPAPAILTESLPFAAVGRHFAAHLDGVGGSAPLKWSLDGGTLLPSGCELDETTGMVTGTPSVATNSTILVVLTDRFGATASRAFAAEVAAAVPLTKKRALVPVAVTTPLPTRSLHYFELTAGTVLDVSVKGGGAAKNVPTLRVYRPDGTELDVTGFVSANVKGLKLRKFPVPASGRWFVAIVSGAGFEGTMKATISITPPAKFTATATVDATSPAPVEARFSAPPGALVTISVAPAKKSTARPVIVDVLDPDGASLLAGGKLGTKGKAATFTSKVRLAGGDHRVLLSAADGSPGSVIWTVNLKLPKTYDFALPDLAAGDEP